MHEIVDLIGAQSRGAGESRQRQVRLKIMDCSVPVRSESGVLLPHRMSVSEDHGLYFEKLKHSHYKEMINTRRGRYI